MLYSSRSGCLAVSVLNYSRRVISCVGNAPCTCLSPEGLCLFKHAIQFHSASPCLPDMLSSSSVHFPAGLGFWVGNILCLRSQLASPANGTQPSLALSLATSLMPLIPTCLPQQCSWVILQLLGLINSFPAWVYCLLTQF